MAHRIFLAFCSFLIISFLSSCFTWSKAFQNKGENELSTSLAICRAENEELSLIKEELQHELDSMKRRYTEELVRWEAQPLSPIPELSPDSLKSLESEIDTFIAEEEILAAESFLIEEKVESINQNVCMRISYGYLSFDVYLVKDPNDLIFFLKDKKKSVIGGLTELKRKLEKEGLELVFATNGGMYKDGRWPQGLYVENGMELSPIDLRIEEYGNFYMQPNGIFLVDRCGRGSVIASTDYPLHKENVVFATQSGPMLIYNGIINSHFIEGSENVHIRNGVGIDSAGNIIFAISNQRVNFITFACLFKDVFHCHNALYLDGAISRMYLPEMKRNQLGGEFGPMIGIVKRINAERTE